MQKGNSSMPSTSNVKALALRNRFSAEELLAHYNPSIQNEVSHIVDVSEIATLDRLPSIALAIEAYGRDEIFAWLQLQLAHLAAYCGVREPNESQMHSLTCDILANFHYIKLWEIIICISRIRRGLYEKFYGSFDPVRVYESFSEYAKDRRRDIDRYESRLAADKREAELASADRHTLEELKTINPELYNSIKSKL